MASITLVKKDFDRIIDEMIAKKNQLLPELNINPDDNIPSVIRTLLEAVGIEVEWLVNQLNVVGNQNYIKTATAWEPMGHLCANIGYKIPTQTPARTTLTINFKDSVIDDTIIYPQWTQFATLGTSTEERIIFETEVELTKLPGITSVTVPIVQGERISNEFLGSSNGSAFQTYVLEQYPVIIDDTLEIWVIDSDTAVATKWTRVDSLLAYTGEDKVYEIDYDENVQVTIKFGNGTWGKVPSIGNLNIMGKYRIGGGSTGNVGANKITVMVDRDSAFDSCTNEEAATGGTDKEEMNVIRMKAPNSIKYSDRVVATEDFHIRAMEYPGVARATQYAREYGENTMGVRIVPTGGGDASESLCVEVENYIRSVSTTTLDIYVSSVKYHDIEIDATVYLQSDASEDDVDETIKDALNNYFDPTYINDDGEFEVEFGETVYLAKLYHIIMDVGEPKGVLNVIFTLPTTDVEINHYELPQLKESDLTLTYIQY